MEIKVTINAPDLAAAIQSLADAIVAAGCIPVQINTKAAQDTRSNEELAKEIELPAEHAAEPAADPAPAAAISLEEVRAKLADLSRKGKQAQVKDLLHKYNAKKLTEIPPDKYAEVLAAAGAI